MSPFGLRVTSVEILSHIASRMSILSYGIDGPTAEDSNEIVASSLIRLEEDVNTSTGYTCSLVTQTRRQSILGRGERSTLLVENIAAILSHARVHVQDDTIG